MWSLKRRERMSSQALKDHVHATYIGLRYGICAIGFLLPVALLAVGWWLGIEWQESISQYYHTPAGDVFVGALCGIGAFLYLYKGFSKEENVALNIAGISAIGIALFPTRISPGNLSRLRTSIYPDTGGQTRAVVDGTGEPWSCWSVHFVAALVFFFAIAWVCIRCGDDTLHLVPEPRHSRLRKRYFRIGILMIVVPVLAAVAELFDIGSQYHVVFVVEWAAILVFSAFWWTKSREFAGLLSVPECIVPDAPAYGEGQCESGD